MFSALKKLVGSEQAPGRDKNIPAGLQSMNQALQRRFAKGVQYNSECSPAWGSCGGTWKVGARVQRVPSRGVRRPQPRRPGLVVTGAGLAREALGAPSRSEGLAVCVQVS